MKLLKITNVCIKQNSFPKLSCGGVLEINAEGIFMTISSYKLKKR